MMNIQKTFYKVADFANWLKNGQLKLSPEFQRRSVWKNGAKSYLIDTIIKGMPIPIIFLRDKRINVDQFEPIREVVDGQQRLRTVLSFVCPEYLPDYNPDRDDFTVSKSHNSKISGKTFDKLDADDRYKILNYEFDTHILPSKIDDREIIQIFRRMNSTSFSVNKQELRNSNYFGAFKTSVYGFATEQLHRWRKWQVFTEDNISRMAEVELTTECVEFMIEKNIGGKSPGRLDKLYADYDEVFENKEEIEKRFQFIFDYINEIFGNNPTECTFLKKSLFYTFYAFLYSSLYNYANFDKSPNPKTFTVEQVGKLKTVNDRLRERTAPQDVLESTDRRTTNPKERKLLFEYLKQQVNNA